MPPLRIDQALFDSLISSARQSPRGRKNLNFHQQLDDPCQRLLNAMQPESYIQPHRHFDPPREETLVALRGRLLAVLFDGTGKVEAVIPFGVGAEVLGVNIPPGCWHSFVALEPGSLFFETKAGPYQPLTKNERADWAPAEGEPGTVEYLAALRRLDSEALCPNSPK